MYADRSSFGRYGGRSPYADYADYAGREHTLADNIEYLDGDYNVIQPSQQYIHEAATDDDPDAPDVLRLQVAGRTYVFEFAPFAIAEEAITVRDLRERVAKHLDHEPGQVKLMYKDRELKRNDASLKYYKCKQNSEIDVILMRENRNYDRKDNSDSDSYASSRTGQDSRRPRSYSTNRPRDRDGREPPSIRTTYTGTNGYLHPHGTPTTASPRHGSPARTTARAPSPAPTSTPRQAPVARSPPPPAIQKPMADPSTSLGKIQTIAYEYHTKWAPLIADFIKSPPHDKDDRLKEYRKLSDIAEKQVFLRGDAIENDGPQKEEIRTTRKKLYAEVHADLKELDRYKPKE